MEAAGVRSRKRKADALGRVTASSILNDDGNDPRQIGDRVSAALSCSGRGRLSGWTTCPLCGLYSTKRYALGRGIASHLHAVHTPWKPGKMEQKKRRRMAEQQHRRNHGSTAEVAAAGAEAGVVIPGVDIGRIVTLHETLQPTQKNIDEWDTRVLKIVADIEERAYRTGNNDSLLEVKEDFHIVRPGLDRNGKDSQDYHQSLPPFLSAAATGNLVQLREMVQQAEEDDRNSENRTITVDECANTESNMNHHIVIELLDSRDRHLSSAEHWAAGGGHLDCLQYLLQLRRHYSIDEVVGIRKKSNRRRDGKTCLHYATRNGHLHCVEFLIEQQKYEVDDVSGDGTTPFHMACFGGHVMVAKYLIEKGADIMLTNDWGCGAAHWIGMTKNTSETDTRALCRLLLSLGVSFVVQQKHGHTPLHKAAQKLNRHVIEFLAQSTSEGGAGLTEEQKRLLGLPDMGGHLASEMWGSVGGESEFGQRMKDIWGW